MSFSAGFIFALLTSVEISLCLWTLLDILLLRLERRTIIWHLL